MKSVRDTLNYAIGSGIYSDMWNIRTESIGLSVIVTANDETWLHVDDLISGSVSVPVSNYYEFQ